MSNAVATFTYLTHPIRVIEIDNQPWFVARDVLETLGMDYNQPQNYLGRLSKTEKVIVTQGMFRGLFTGRSIKAPRLTLLSESGLYKLIMRSDKANARKFQDWVTRDVLPAIRKDGGYILGEEKVATGELSEDELVFRAMEVMKRKIERLQSENAVMHRELNEVTVDEWRALNHLYLTHSDKVRLGHHATRLADKRRIQLATQHRTVMTARGEVDTTLKVYPRGLLDEVAENLGLR
jgi:prophage antirepressor-like protein